MLKAAKRGGKRCPGGIIVEATFGITGVGLAVAAAVQGYRCIFVMSDKMSEEKARLLRARVIITPTAFEPEDPRPYYSVAKLLVGETPNSILAGQYWNLANPAAAFDDVSGDLGSDQKASRLSCLRVGQGRYDHRGGAILQRAKLNVKVIGVDLVDSVLSDSFKAGGQIPPVRSPRSPSQNASARTLCFRPSTLYVDVAIQASVGLRDIVGRRASDCVCRMSFLDVIPLKGKR